MRPLSIVAVEMCVRYEPGSGSRAALHQLVARHPETSTYGDKWRLLSDAAKILLADLPNAERGCWDFFDDDARAQRDFDMWTKGMTTREGARSQPHEVDPYRGGEPLFYTFTIAVLIEQGVPSERELCRRLQIPEASLWERATFARVLQAIQNLSYASVRGDVFYLIPGDERWGLSRGDLLDPKFHYLRPIVG